MLYEIKNEKLTVAISDLGAELMSIRDARGTEYLWQGDSAYWSGRAPTLFPTVGRLWNKTYRVKGSEYAMEIHGFAKKTVFSVARQGEDAITFFMDDTPETYGQYPYHFRFSVRYQLRGAELEVVYRVENRDDETMHFGLGGHPGFRVPVFEGEEFEQYRVVFGEKRSPFRVGFSEACLRDETDAPYGLENGDTIALRHDLFDNDAIFLGNVAKTASLTGPLGTVVRVRYPQMDYVGLWHAPKTDAPYVCVEPWKSLPGHQDVVEDFSTRRDMLHLPAGESYENRWEMEFPLA